jgi:hypothetical protein
MNDFDSNEHDKRNHSLKMLRTIFRYSFAGLALIVGAALSCQMIEPDLDVEAIKASAYDRGKMHGMEKCIP